LRTDGEELIDKTGPRLEDGATKPQPQGFAARDAFLINNFVSGLDVSTTRRTEAWEVPALRAPDGLLAGLGYTGPQRKAGSPAMFSFVMEIG
jgi:hypothetical protein